MTRKVTIVKFRVIGWNGAAGDGRPGAFGEAIGRLDYLVRLGVNAVELLPVANEDLGQPA